MEQRELENGMSARGALDNDSERVAALLGALPRVEAPSNFDFGVKARIAEGRPQRASLVPFLKLVAPLCLLLIVGAFIVSYSVWPDKTNVSQVNVLTATTDETRQTPPTSTQAQLPSVSVPNAEERTDVPPVIASPDTRDSGPIRRTTGSNRANRSQGSSTDFAVRPAPVIVPRGFESANPQANSNTNGGPEIQVGDVLRQLGLEGSFGGDGWKVSSATANSIADRSGIKSGDVIESMDGKPIGQLGSIKGSFAPKVVSVRRDGKSISLTLRN